MAIFQKSYFCPKMSVFGQNGPKIMFCPTLHFYIMPNLKVHIFSFVMMYDVGVCRGRTLSRPKMLFRRSPIMVVPPPTRSPSTKVMTFFLSFFYEDLFYVRTFFFSFFLEN